MDASFFENLLSTYGSFAIFLLLVLPLGEEMVIVPAGILVEHQQLELIPTLLCAYAGVLVCDFLWYLLAYHYGTPLLHKRWFKRIVHPRRLLQAKHQIEQRGAWVITTARFIPASRTAAMVMAGILHMRPWKFALVECSCAILTVPLQLALGILVARGVGSRSTAHMVMSMIGVVILVLAVSMAAAWWRRHRRGQGPAPRAKASWLRRFRVPRIHGRKAKSTIQGQGGKMTG